MQRTFAILAEGTREHSTVVIPQQVRSWRSGFESQCRQKLLHFIRNHFNLQYLSYLHKCSWSLSEF